MNDPSKRTCPFCAEAIEQKAKICPRCRQWLTWKSFRHPTVSVLLHGVPMLVFWIVFADVMFSSIEGLQNPKPYYSKFPDSLHILTSQMNWAKTHDGLRIYLTGVLTNSSPESWKDTEFDCRFFDAQGVMLDADVGHSYMTVLPCGDAAFRVAIAPIAPTNQYASFKIRVGNARNGKGLF
jgi:predicted nucleic acid-binding Zn ribbon protein